MLKKGSAASQSQGGALEICKLWGPRIGNLLSTHSLHTHLAGHVEVVVALVVIPRKTSATLPPTYMYSGRGGACIFGPPSTRQRKTPLMCTPGLPLRRILHQMRYIDDGGSRWQPRSGSSPAIVHMARGISIVIVEFVARRFSARHSHSCQVSDESWRTRSGSS